MATGKPSSSSSPSRAHDLFDPGSELVELRRDQVAGARVQQSMLPTSPVLLGSYRIDFQFLVAGALSGDFIAVAQWPDGDFAFVVADVAGHGTAAALVTVLIKSFMLRLPASSFTEPAEILGGLNEELLALGAPRHICSVCGVVNAAHVLKLAGAGAYPRPLLLRAAPESTPAVAVDLKGRALGLFDDPECTQTEFSMQPKDRLTVVTDGALELIAGASALEKEEALMAAAQARSFEGFFESLGLPRDAKGPDDIVWFSLERLA